MDFGQSGQVLENALIALQSFILENGVTISPEKQARLVRFLVEDLAQAEEFDLSSTHRYLKAAL